MYSIIMLHARAAGPEMWERRDLAEVVDPLAEPEPHVLLCLLYGLRNVHRAHQSPLVAIDVGPELGGPFLHDAEVLTERVEPFGA